MEKTKGVAGARHLPVAIVALKLLLANGEHRSYRIIDGLPRDARLVGSFQDPNSPECIVLTFVSAEWAPVLDGSAIPFLTVTVEEHR